MSIDWFRQTAMERTRAIATTTPAAPSRPTRSAAIRWTIWFIRTIWCIHPITTTGATFPFPSPFPIWWTIPTTTTTTKWPATRRRPPLPSTAWTCTTTSSNSHRLRPRRPPNPKSGLWRTRPLARRHHLRRPATATSAAAAATAAACQRRPWCIQRQQQRPPQPPPRLITTTTIWRPSVRPITIPGFRESTDRWARWPPWRVRTQTII